MLTQIFEHSRSFQSFAAPNIAASDVPAAISCAKYAIAASPPVVPATRPKLAAIAAALAAALMPVNCAANSGSLFL